MTENETSPVISGLSLTVSTDHADGPQQDDIDQISSDLGRHVELSQIGTVAHLAEGDIPAYITLLGDALTWVELLKVPAAVYLVVVAKHLADATKDAIKRRGAYKPAGPLMAVATTIEREVNGKYKRPVEFSFGLNSPNRRLGSVVVVQGGETKEDIASKLARFCVLSARIEAETNEFITKHGYQPEHVSQITLELQEDGGALAAWEAVNSKREVVAHELHIPPSDPGSE